MTARAGILHEEFHSREFTSNGGTLRMVQLWVNLPAKDKMTAPRYQTLPDADIPAVALPAGAGTVRVIAGDYGGHRGPAQTFTPMDVWDLRLDAERGLPLELHEGRSVLLVVLRGAVVVNGEQTVREAQMAVLGREGRDLSIETETGQATVLLLSGEPIDEPIVGYGPFVMNTAEEIQQAVVDFNSGRFGRIRPAEAAHGSAS
jgi:hypothetical protein